MDKSLLTKLVDDEVNVKKTALTEFATKLWKFAKNRISSRYGYSIEITEQFLISIANNFIKNYDANFDRRNKNESDLLQNCTFTILIDKNTILHIIAGDPFNTNTSTKMILKASSNDRSNFGTDLKIYLYGKYAKKYLNILKSKIKRKPTGALRIFNISTDERETDKETSFQSVISDLSKRDISTLFYEGNTKEEVVDHIDGFFKSKSLYEEKNINYKTSILLYGPPGTGKSSLACALANKYGIDMVLIDLNNFDKLNTNMVTKCINGDDKTYLVLLEDIDTVFNVDRASQETLEKDDKKVINKLLQFLDSNSSPNNVIFICTTNHIDKLDEAILRKGRIDKKVYIGPINKDRAREMCNSFNTEDKATNLSEENINEILNKYSDDDLINQSSLQGEILDIIKANIVSGSDEIEIEKIKEEAE